MRTFADIPGEIARRVAAGERVVLVLLDAFGRELLEREHDHPLLQRLALTPLDSQFPSTTAAHVTTLHTGEPVQTHGLYEWRVWEPSLDDIIVPLRFRRDRSDVDAELAGRLDPAALIPGPTFYAQLPGGSLVAHQPGVGDSPYSAVATAGATALMFDTLAEGLQRVTHALRADPELRYAYVYWPEIDRAGHHHGPSSQAFRAAARAALDEVAAHADGLQRAGATVLVTADHGQVDVHPDRVDYLDEVWPPLTDHLTQRAAGSCRDVFLHVAPGMADHVIDSLQERLGDRALVCRAHELFRPPLGERLTRRLADVCVLPADGREAWLRATPSVEAWNLGQHGGRASAETSTYLAEVR